MRKIITFIAFMAMSFCSFAAVVNGQGTWETTLLARDLDGDSTTAEAYYDTVQDITWLADANYYYTRNPVPGFFGTDTWARLTAFADSLTLGGYTEWRLPYTVDVGNDGCSAGSVYVGVDCGYNITAHSEMSQLFYETLGNLALCDTDVTTCSQPGWGLTNTGPFSNVQASVYWSATEYAPDTTRAWMFSFLYGSQDHHYKRNHNIYAWFVHSGDVGSAVVPVPAAAWLFLCALGGLIGIKRRFP